jgi:hypothetical protein
VWLLCRWPGTLDARLGAALAKPLGCSPGNPAQGGSTRGGRVYELTEEQPRKEERDLYLREGPKLGVPIQDCVEHHRNRG